MSEMGEAQFGRRAREILQLIADLRGEIGLNEAIRVAVERYVEGESDSVLRDFSDVMAFARRQALLQQRLDDDREALHGGRLDHHERVEVGHHYETLRHEACVYNHTLRRLIASAGEHFSRDQLMEWLTTASQGRSQWARGEVTGAVSEIALHAALQGMRELRELRYASVEEDLAGYDFVAQWQGQLVTFDAKTGFYAPLIERKHGHRHIEISVPREAVDGFQITRRALDVLRREVRHSLHSEMGLAQHAPHHHYRTVPA